MSTDPRVRAVELAQKLLRTAAPTSGATEPERASAALHAADIISKHGLTVALPVPVAKRPRVRRQQAPSSSVGMAVHDFMNYHTQQASSAHWTAVELSDRCQCVVCGVDLYAGDEAFFAADHGYRCHDIACGT